MKYVPEVELEEVNGDSMAKDITLWILKLQYLKKEDKKKQKELLNQYRKKIQEINSKGGKMDEIVQDIIELLNQCLIKTVDNVASSGMIDESTRKQMSSFKQLVKETRK